MQYNNPPVVVPSGSIPVNVLCYHAFHTPFRLHLLKGDVCGSWLRTDETPPTGITASPVSSATLLWTHEILPYESSITIPNFYVVQIWTWTITSRIQVFWMLIRQTQWKRHHIWISSPPEMCLLGVRKTMTSIFLKSVETQYLVSYRLKSATISSIGTDPSCTISWRSKIGKQPDNFI